MKNPYIILNVPQDANNGQILRAMTMAIRKNEYTKIEIAQARNQLSKPATRLAADFTIPIFEHIEELEPLVPSIQFELIDINTIDTEKYNSL